MRHCVETEYASIASIASTMSRNFFLSFIWQLSLILRTEQKLDPQCFEGQRLESHRSLSPTVAGPHTEMHQHPVRKHFHPSRSGNQYR